jgi:1,4-dihydroxy-2-naphthoate octaprenyltransferase
MLLIVYALMYALVPAILFGVIGWWTFLVYIVWLFGSYHAVEKSCKEREHMPMMEHTDALGVMMFISIPTVLSALAFLIIYPLFY